MATPKIQASRALKVIPSDYCNIPYPQEVFNGNLAAASGSIIEDVNGGFVSNPSVKAGDIFYSRQDNVAYTVVVVISNTELQLNFDSLETTLTAPSGYEIYAGDANQGCVLYIGTSADTDVTTVTTAGGDDIEFVNLPKGSFVPVQVIAVKATTTDTSDIVALW